MKNETRFLAKWAQLVKDHIKLNKSTALFLYELKSSLPGGKSGHDQFCEFFADQNVAPLRYEKYWRVACAYDRIDARFWKHLSDEADAILGHLCYLSAQGQRTVSKALADYAIEQKCHITYYRTKRVAKDKGYTSSAKQGRDTSGTVFSDKCRLEDFITKLYTKANTQLWNLLPDIPEDVTSAMTTQAREQLPQEACV